MRIPKNLKHLRKRKGEALLLVTGVRDAVIYRVSKGTVVVVDAFKLSFSHLDFMSELIVHIKNLTSDKLPSIYLFTPGNIKQHIMKVLPTDIRKHIKAVVEGNYINLSTSEMMLRLA